MARLQIENDHLKNSKMHFIQSASDEMDRLRHQISNLSSQLRGMGCSPNKMRSIQYDHESVHKIDTDSNTKHYAMNQMMNYAMNYTMKSTETEDTSNCKNTKTMDESPEFKTETMALELRRLVSPEKALYLLCKLVASKPSLWVDLQRILSPNDALNRGDPPLTPLDDGDETKNAENSANTENAENTENEGKKEDAESPQYAMKSVLGHLRRLQLSELPTDTLGIITSFLSLQDSLRWSGTNAFFNRSVPKHIPSVSVEGDITRSVYNLLSKAEHLRSLAVHGWHQSMEEKTPFLVTMNNLKSVETMRFKNIDFVANQLEQCRFDGGRYSVRDLEIVSCSGLDRSQWLPMTSSLHSPNLETLRIELDDEGLIDEREDGPFARRERTHSVHDFVVDLARSTEHRQIRNLALNVHGDDILRSMRMNPFFIGNLKKLELGLMDRHCRHSLDRGSDIAMNFRRLFSMNGPSDCAVFANLEMLLIDFCPDPHGGFNNVSPSDLSEFSASIPTVFPALKLLALYGSRSELMFGDEHLHGLLDGHCIDQIIDLSLGFQYLSDHCIDRLAVDILGTFRNVAWLTLQSQHFLAEPTSTRFQRHLVRAVDGRHHNLQWVTLCGAECDQILSLSNGLFLEHWDRGIAQCQFDEALQRSTNIVQNKQDRARQQMEDHAANRHGSLPGYGSVTLETVMMGTDDECEAWYNDEDSSL